MLAPLSRRVLAIFVASLMIGVVVGCSEPVGSISGEVKVKDKPVPFGLIAFQTQGRKPKLVSGEIKDGKYSVASVPVGEVVVTVQSVAIKAAPPPKGTKATPPAPTVTVPPKYADPKKSGLTFTVQQGENTYNPPIEPEAKPEGK